MSRLVLHGFVSVYLTMEINCEAAKRELCLLNFTPVSQY